MLFLRYCAPYKVRKRSKQSPQLCGYADVRLGTDGLAAVVTQHFGGQLTEKSIFFF